MGVAHREKKVDGEASRARHGLVAELPRPPGSLVMHGEFGEAVFILSKSEFRVTEELHEGSARTFSTADGSIYGPPGYYAVTTNTFETFPVRPDIFHGTYHVLGRVGPHLIAERLAHLRVAWPVISASAQIRLNQGQGPVTLSKGDWAYRSDDDDFGPLNRKAAPNFHTIVGKVSEVRRHRWAQRYERSLTALTVLPPVLALLALIALKLHFEKLSLDWVNALLASEAVLLGLGALLVQWMQRNRWLVRACVESSQRLGRRFQLVVRALGDRPSDEFPDMALWRSAQRPTSKVTEPTSPELREAEDREIIHAVAETQEELNERIEDCESRELWTNRLSLGAVLLLIVANFLLVLGPHHASPAADYLHIAAVWLPALIVMLHSRNYRLRTNDRITAMRDFSQQLQFVRDRFDQLTAMSVGDDERVKLRAAGLRLLCTLVASHSQKELMFALSNEAPLPI